ncbi:MAG: glutathione S-transferase family protein [Spirulinaceae cyanobacterium]
MLKLYHQPISANSRRVWIALLEKCLAFEEVIIKLDGDQFAPDFIKISPFHRVPVLIDNDLILVESLAILNYLEAKYPTPTLLPKEPQAFAKVSMVQMVTINELLPAMTRLTTEAVGITQEPEKAEKAKQKVLDVLNFFEQLLGEDKYFSGNNLTLADITAGTVIPTLPMVGVPLGNHPKLAAWSEHLMSRDSWQKTQFTQEEVEAFIPHMKVLIKSYMDK